MLFGEGNNLQRLEVVERYSIFIGEVALDFSPTLRLTLVAALRRNKFPLRLLVFIKPPLICESFYSLALSHFKVEKALLFMNDTFCDHVLLRIVLDCGAINNFN